MTLKFACAAVVALALGLGAAASAQTAAPQAQAVAPTAQAPLDRARLAAFVDGAVRQAMRVDHIAGVSVAIVDRGGVALTRGYGLSRIGPDAPTDETTLFRVASISKTPTWIAVMQMVEQGKLTLDDPINDHLPEALRIPDDGFSEPILVRHLMTHSAGFEDSALGHLFITDPSHVLPMDEYLVRYRPRRVRPPGVVGAYSNYGASLAGAMVAHMNDMDWDTYVETRILRPLGMTTATYREPYTPEIAQAHGLPAPIAPELAPRITDGFFWEAGRFVRRDFEYITHTAPAGGMSASAVDMAAYMQALLDPARMERAGVLRAQTALSLREPLFANTDIDGFGPLRHGFLDQFAVRPLTGFGHDGDTIYQHSMMSLIPELGFGMFVSVNTTQGVRLRATLLNNVLEEFYGVRPPPITRAPDALAQSQRVAGSYRPLRRPYYRSERAIFRLLAGQLTATPEGDLLAVLGGEPRRLVPLGDGVFQDANSAARVAFREVDGRMRMYDPMSISPSDRLTFLESPTWLALAALLALIAAASAVQSAARAFFTRKTHARGLAFAALGLVWLAAGGLLMAALIPWLNPDQGAVLFGYPGPLFPLACWALLGAVIATIAAFALVGWRWRPQGWRAWAGTGFALIAYGALSLTLWEWGFLGFSTF